MDKTVPILEEGTGCWPGVPFWLCFYEYPHFIHGKRRQRAVKGHIQRHEAKLQVELRSLLCGGKQKRGKTTTTTKRKVNNGFITGFSCLSILGFPAFLQTYLKGIFTCSSRVDHLIQTNLTSILAPQNLLVWIRVPMDSQRNACFWVISPVFAWWIVCSICAVLGHTSFRQFALW